MHIYMAIKNKVLNQFLSLVVFPIHFFNGRFNYMNFGRFIFSH